MAAFKKLGNNYLQLVNDEIPLQLRTTSTRPSPPLLSHDLPQRTYEGDFVEVLCGPAKQKENKSLGSTWRDFRSGQEITLHRTQMSTSPLLFQICEDMNDRKMPKSCSTVTLPPMKSMSSSHSSQGAEAG